MTVTINKNDRVLEVSVEGKLDAITSEEFLQKIEQALTGIDSIEIDCTGLEYISSAGLRALIALSNDLGDEDGAIRLRNVGEQVADVLKLTGTAEIFPVID